VVMNHAHIEQVGTPSEVHDFPATPFVSEFLRGTPLQTVPAGR
jgi:sulfate/thiosulfate transport system ATP-binding protein